MCGAFDCVAGMPVVRVERVGKGSVRSFLSMGGQSPFVLHSVLLAVPRNRRGQEPRVAGIERAGRVGQAVKRGLTLRETQNLLTDAHPQIAGHRHARTAVSHRVMHAVLHTGMGQFVKGIGDSAAPRMGHLVSCEIRKYPAHVCVKFLAANCGIGLCCRHAPAKEDAGSVG